jgi:hypothetical protein
MGTASLGGSIGTASDCSGFLISVGAGHARDLRFVASNRPGCRVAGQRAGLMPAGQFGSPAELSQRAPRVHTRRRGQRRANLTSPKQKHRPSRAWPAPTESPHSQTTCQTMHQERLCQSRTWPAPTETRTVSGRAKRCTGRGRADRAQGALPPSSALLPSCTLPLSTALRSSSALRPGSAVSLRTELRGIRRRAGRGRGT